MMDAVAGREAAAFFLRELRDVRRNVCLRVLSRRTVGEKNLVWGEKGGKERESGAAVSRFVAERTSPCHRPSTKQGGVEQNKKQERNRKGRQNEGNGNRERYHSPVVGLKVQERGTRRIGRGLN
jgi:hypothetical protein